MTFFPGIITREQTVWCWCTRNSQSESATLVNRFRKVGDECWQHHTEAGPVARRAREDGWKKIGRYGYTCPSCQRAMARVTPGAWLSVDDHREAS